MIDFIKNKFSILFLFPAFFVSTTTLATPNDAFTAFKAGNYSEALKAYLLQAQKGDTHAQYKLGEMYATGKGVPEDDGTAAEWFHKSAEGSNRSSQFYLGLMYAAGQGLSQNDNEALSWLNKAAMHGYSSVSISQASKEGILKNFQKVFDWMHREADTGNYVAQYYMGVIYSTGINTKKDEWLGGEFYLKAADQGYAPAENALAEIYEYGELYAGENFERAIYLYSDSCDKGFAYSCSSLGRIYNSGNRREGILQNYKRAAYWTLKAAELGDAWSQNDIGKVYETGIGFDQDFNQAVYWYGKSAAQGFTSAQYNLGEMYLNGRGVQQDDEEAYFWFILGSASKYNKKAMSSRDALAERMDVRLRANAEAKAKNWISQ